MKKYISILFGLVILFSTLILSLIYTDLKYSIVGQQNPEVIKKYQVWVDGVIELQNKLNSIHPVRKEECEKFKPTSDDPDKESECIERELISFDFTKHFDVNKYFNVLKNISMEKGYVLDYNYNKDDDSPKPVLYARSTKSPPPPTLDDDKTFLENLQSSYFDSQGKSPEREEYLVKELKRFYVNKYLRHIVADGSPESFLQLIILTVMGDHFYLQAAAIYNDHTVICHKSGLRNIATYIDPMIERKALPREIFPAAQSIDFAPYVKFQNTRVIVSVVIFTKWGGFERWEYLINRGFPHEIIDIRVHTVLYYDIGENF